MTFGYARRWWTVAAAVGVVVTLTGCQHEGARIVLTLDDAATTTTADMEVLIARIDPALIERIDDRTNESTSCNGPDVDPEQRVRQWENRRSIWFVDSMRPLDGLEVLDELVKARVDDGWTLARDSLEDDGKVRRVQLFSPEADGNQESVYGINIAGGNEVGGRTSLNVSAVSPCFEVAQGESWK
ncbi:hypothetical protein C3B59_00940 [Cryobacterium zongtaii]|uniref:Uncharacterized protein n=1 Tax=Cryobacterium zongtaii TaxID=1259217 RepID=A0A2S3ZQ13_9MICO|nr:hypothetical protein [Cryobacterium zongtaii]POH71204.1 hypothetical protein C3B59_00940 [Cryobacterium zongtaii]